MAYAQSGIRVVDMHPNIVTEFDLTTLEPDQTLNLSHGGPTGATPSKVEWETVVAPTDGSPVYLEHIAASDSTTANTVRIRVRTLAGGSLSGATVRVRVMFRAASSGGIGTWVSRGGTTIP